MNDLSTFTIKEFCAKQGFVQISPAVRTNVNGYPYLTFIKGDNTAENIYFSRKAAAALGAGVPVTKDMLKVYQIGITKNEQGEDRVKLISNSERIDIASLLD